MISMEETGKLGFGLMRLPRTIRGIDVKQVSEMVDHFLAAGFTYFDTAYVYPGSEAAIRRALVERYPRESYTLATKVNAFLMAPNEKAAKNQFTTSLSRTGAGYFDYYLLHALMDNNAQKYEKYHLWDFVAEKKQEGLIKHIGFSFHGSPALLERLLTEHPDVDFVQLQINYEDWNNPNVNSRKLYEIARAHDKRIVIMEPVKGGRLAKPPKKVQEIFREVNPNASMASWAIRFAASLPGVLTVLSGMSNVAQMDDNLSFMQNFQPLGEKEQEAVRRAQQVFGNADTIPCTACHYCTGGCPKHIPIPEIFAAANLRLGNGQLEEAKKQYLAATSAEGVGSAGDCIECRQCERACPQHLKITELLKKSRELLEE